MTEQAARALAETIGARANGPMPSSRSWGVELERADGRFAGIEDGAGWVYRDKEAYLAYHRDGDPEAVVDSAEWSEWGVTESWANALARVIGGEAYQSGGNIWVVLFKRPDSRFIVIGDDGADVYESEKHYESYYDGGWPEPESIYWSDAPAKP